MQKITVDDQRAARAFNYNLIREAITTSGQNPDDYKFEYKPVENKVTKDKDGNEVIVEEKAVLKVKAPDNTTIDYINEILDASISELTDREERKKSDLDLVLPHCETIKDIIARLEALEKK